MRCAMLHEAMLCCADSGIHEATSAIACAPFVLDPGNGRDGLALQATCDCQHDLSVLRHFA